MKSVEDILSKIDSDDKEVLKLCNAFLDERIEKERLRGESAERRANILLGVVGAVSVFMVFLASDVLGKNDNPHVLLIIFYGASALWLARSIWYSMKSIHAQSRYRLTAESVFDFQNGTDVKALKQIISGKYWEHEKSIQPNTERLFYVQRSQRSLVVVVGLLLCFGLLTIVNGQLKYVSGTCVPLFVSFVLIVFLFFGDWVIEKAGMWNH